MSKDAEKTKKSVKIIDANDNAKKSAVKKDVMVKMSKPSTEKKAKKTAQKLAAASEELEKLKNKTGVAAKKSSVTVKKSEKSEKTAISEKPKKKPAKKVEKSAKIAAEKEPRVIDSVVIEKKVSEEAETKKQDLPAEATEETSTIKQKIAKIKQKIAKKKGPEKVDEKTPDGVEPRFSKPKAALIAAAAALVTGGIGGYVVYLVNKQEVRYCTVEFEANGGTEVMAQEVVCGYAVAKPDQPTKEGFEFQDWIYQGVPYNFGVAVNDDLLLVAKWLMKDGVEAVTITFDSNGGSEVTAQKVAKGKKTTAPVAPRKDGYSFGGWLLDDETFDFETTPITKDITLKAWWIKDQPEVATPQESQNQNQDQTQTQSQPEKILAKGLSISGTGEVMATKAVEWSYSVSPSNAELELTLSVSNSRIATCALNAGAKKINCTGVAEGTATVTLRDKNSGKTVVKNLKVTPLVIPVSQVNVSSNAVYLEIRDGVAGYTTVTATVLPENATDKTASWWVDNASVASVYGGRIVARGAGRTTVHVKAGEIQRDIEVNVSVYVTPEPETPSDPEGGSEGDDEGGESGGSSEGEGEGSDPGEGA